MPQSETSRTDSLPYPEELQRWARYLWREDLIGDQAYGILRMAIRQYENYG